MVVLPSCVAAPARTHAALGFVGDQALAKVVEHGEVEHIVVEWQVQRILPVDAREYRFHRVTVGQVFERLEDCDQGEQHGRDTWLALLVVQVSEILVAVLLVEQVADELVGVVGGKVLSAPTGNFEREGARWLWF